jgi:small subunit ribosomal protein S6
VLLGHFKQKGKAFIPSGNEERLMNTYESLFIVRPSLSEEEVKKMGEKIRAVVEKEGGSILNSEDWGKRKLAFEVSKEKKGNYLVYFLKGPGTMVRELEKLKSVEDALIRSLIVKSDRPPQAQASAPQTASAPAAEGAEAGDRG